MAVRKLLGTTVNVDTAVRINAMKARKGISGGRGSPWCRRRFFLGQVTPCTHEALWYKPEDSGFEPIPVDERSKARVCCRSLANPTGGMDVCVVSKDKKAKMHDNQDKEPVRMKYRVQENTKKKKIPVGLLKFYIDVSLVTLWFWGRLSL